MRLSAICAAFILIAGLDGVPAARSAPSVGEIRAITARWLADHDRIMATLVATETCSQRVHVRDVRGESRSTRVLVSEFAWVPVIGARELVGVRAVRLVDGHRVGDAGRLDELLRAPAAQRDAQVAALLAESVRHLQVPSAVNFNYPTFPLGYLRADDADGMRWSVRQGGAADAVVLRFRETRRALVRAPDGRPIKAEGSFVVHRETGQVLESSVRLNDARTFVGTPSGLEWVRYEARVRYADDGRLALRVPAVLEDRYEWRRRSSEIAGAGELIIDGRATYDGFRRFDTAVRVIP